MGESREKRINQFHEENTVPVVALPEGSMLRCNGDTITILGQGGGAIVFESASPRKQYSDGDDLSHLLV